MGSIIKILFLFFICFGITIAGITPIRKNETNGSQRGGVRTRKKVTENQKVISLCARIHNNTAFIGAQPIQKIIVKSASECQKSCMDLHPKCTAVVFYYVYSGKKNQKNHICYLFDKNSVNETVALVPEKPINKKDIVRSLEIVGDCHEFDAFPPLHDSFVVSSDNVARDKREIGYGRPVVTTGPWSPWSSCSTRSLSQVRSQACEYGRNIQKRQCAPQYPPTQAAYSQPTYMPEAQYPPQPYSHPSEQSDEYAIRMAEHQRQLNQACCNRQEQQLQDYYNRQQGEQQAHAAVPYAEPCPELCPTHRPMYQPSSIGWASWTQWTVCSVSCGSGQQQRSRSCDGNSCPGDSVEYRPCDLRPCNMWSEWCDWSQCSGEE